MDNPTFVEIDGVTWEKWDYGHGDFMLQRECPDCDKGLLVAPARFCAHCAGTGYITKRNPYHEAESVTDPEHEDQPTLPPAEGEVTIDKGILRAVLDACTGTLDFGSGFLVDEEVLALRATATLIGLDPNLVTPSNFICQYDPPHLWQYGKDWSGPGWRCPRCSASSTSPPADWVAPDDWEPIEPDPPRPPGPGLMSTSIGLLRSTATPTGDYCWINYADPTRRGGEQFLGVVIVEGGPLAAVQAAGRLGIIDAPPESVVTVTLLEPGYVPGAQWRNRLLTRDEARQAHDSLYGPLSLLR